MTPAGPPTGAVPPAPDDRAGGFAAELEAAFDRLAPQGGTRWNFASAFTRLDEAFGRRPPDSPLAARVAAPSPGGEAWAGAAPGRPGGGVRRAADRWFLPRLSAWVRREAAAAATTAAR